MIALEDVTVRLQDRTVLSGITTQLNERRIGVIGSNGSGKSTFARLLNGLLLPSAGKVLVDGMDTRKSGGAVRRSVGFVFQNPDNQIVMPTVAEDLAFGFKSLKVPKADVDMRVTEMLDRYGLASFREHPAHLLSGGQKQLLALAGALVMHPKHIVLDEPTTFLDLPNRERFMRAVSELEETVILVTHDLPLLESFERVIVIDDAHVACDAVPDVAIDWYVQRVTR